MWSRGARGQGRGRGYRWGHSTFQHRDSTQAAATESRETSRDGNVWIVISSDDAPRGRLNRQNVLSEVSRLITLFATSGGTRISGLGVGGAKAPSRTPLSPPPCDLQ